jgi:hypothetical protein
LLHHSPQALVARFCEQSSQLSSSVKEMSLLQTGSVPLGYLKLLRKKTLPSYFQAPVLLVDYVQAKTKHEILIIGSL